MVCSVCGSPPQDPSGTTDVDISSVYLFEDVATYTCKLGHINISHGSTLTCEADGTWSGEAPSCSRIGRQTVSVETLILCLLNIVQYVLVLLSISLRIWKY